jgi:YgiT-type zinc finger domain-containing protein
MHRRRPKNCLEYPAQCWECSGSVVEATTVILYAEPGSTIQRVAAVPAGICRDCGERYITEETATQIDSPPQESRLRALEGTSSPLKTS